jgi:hypothetical protein
MRRSLVVPGLALMAALSLPATASAQQSFSLYVGGFFPRSLDARSDNDVLLENQFNGDYALLFDLDEFHGATIGAEWLAAIGDRVEAGFGVGYYGQAVDSEYASFEEDDGTLIEQDLRLRVAPLSATVRLVPTGRDSAIQPYFGAGIAVFAWRYSETGEFIDTFDDSVFTDRFVGSGATVGPVLLGGLRFPVGAWDIGGELRYQRAEGELPEDEFLGDTIDLGGMNYLVTFNLRF